MAIQCTTCGTQTRSGAKFCHACGTPIATAALPSTLPLGAPPPPVAKPMAPQPAAETEAINIPTSYFPQTPQTYHAPPPMAPLAPTKKSGNTLKVVLISLAIIMALGIASVIGAVFYVSKRASRTIADLKQKGIGIPNLSTDEGSIPDDKLGVPIYPGAKREKTVLGSLAGVSGGVVIFSTKDDVEEVAAFYRNHFKGKQNQSVSEISDSNDDEGEVVFQVNGDDGSRFLTISSGDRNRTEIVVVIGKGIPGMPGMPPPPLPPPPRNAAERQAQELERRALEQGGKVLRDLEKAQEVPAPPPPPKR